MFGMAEQEAHEGTAIAAPYAAYVHFKDEKKTADPGTSRAWGLEPCVVGKGDVDHRKCVEILEEAGYNGFLALEYEASTDEMVGVPESVAFMKELLGEQRA